ncbi:YdcF family protein [Spirillospora sp. NPDC048911]|uniref:YdcF family protein n=1 Tax=Spirillospora sp. NPDC048911 TaxID=3364527 RepID=UPI0037128496
MIGDHERALARRVWDYLVHLTPLTRSDCVLTLGCHDPRVAEHAARLWHEGWAPLIVISGGRGKVTSAWPETEAQVFAQVMRAKGVPATALLLEETATNTGANITATRKLLAERNLNITRAILVAKPYMTRRSLATAQRQWPDVEWLTSAPEASYDDLATVNECQLIELMVGDLQRMVVYAETGFQMPVPMDPGAWAAHEELAALGFDRYLAKNVRGAP